MGEAAKRGGSGGGREPESLVWSQTRARPPARTYCRHRTAAAAASPAALATATPGSAGHRPSSASRPRPGLPHRRFPVCKLLSSSPRALAPAWKLLHEPISQVETMRRWPPSGPPSRTPGRAVTPHLRLLQGNTSSPCSWIPPSQLSSFSSQSSLRPSPQAPAESPF